jgi:hypothetical protein
MVLYFLEKVFQSEIFHDVGSKTPLDNKSAYDLKVETLILVCGQMMERYREILRSPSQLLYHVALDKASLCIFCLVR